MVFLFLVNPALIHIINSVKEKITDHSDMVWTSYDNAQQLKNELHKIAENLIAGDSTSLEELKHLFLPTAVLQEHAISNGWPDEYLKLAAQFDEVYLEIKNQR